MASLKIVVGNREGETFPIDSDRSGIGRAPDNLIVLSEPAISGHHCAVFRNGNEYTLRDLGSTNGTLLNGVVVAESRLRPDDLIRVGEVDIRIEGNDIALPPAPEEEGFVPPTVALGAPSEGSGPVGHPPAFRAREDSRWVWTTALVLTGILALAALGWFLYTLFKS